jgi:hypothetical protein
VPESSIRAEILAEACELVTKDRNNHYGPPHQDFQRTADMANALGYRAPLGGATRDLKAHDIAVLISLVKLSRIAWSPEVRDHWVDLAGYAACGCECVELEDK